MRVLYLINSLGAGGAERSLAELLPALRQGGVEPTVACLADLTEGVRSAVAELGVDLEVLRGRTLGHQVLDAHRLVGRLEPDIVHTTLFEADVLGRLASVRRRPLVLTSLVNTSYDPARLGDPNVRRGRLRFVQAVDGWTARHLTDHFHAITRAVKAAAVQQLSVRPEKVTVIERGRDPARLGSPSVVRRANARRQLGLDADHQVILSVGRQEYQKGQRFLLQAFVALAAARPRAVLLLAGRDGHASTELRQLIVKAGGDSRIRILGHREDVPELLAAADVFVFPSLYEGLGGAVIEAMALGLPLVASDLPALREVTEAGGNALLVAPGRVPELAGAIATLLDQAELRQRFGVRSRQIFLDRFTLDRSAVRMLELYQGLLSARRRPA